MAQTTSVRSATIAASVSASLRIRHCKRDSDGRHRHHDSRQDRNQDRDQDSRHDRHQDCCLTAPMTRATPVEMCWLGGVTVARAGFAPTGSAGEPAGGVGCGPPGSYPLPTHQPKLPWLAAGAAGRSRRIGRSLGDSGQGAPYRRHCIRRDQSLSVSESCACQTQRQRWQRSLRVQPLASRRLAISTP